jgi:hypothetical protein
MQPPAKTYQPGTCRCSTAPHNPHPQEPGTKHHILSRNSDKHPTMCCGECAGNSQAHELGMCYCRIYYIGNPKIEHMTANHTLQAAQLRTVRLLKAA